MNKIIGLALGAVAMVALSGCNTTGTRPGGGWDGSGSAGGTSHNSVDIRYLKNGYIVRGYDYKNGRNVEFDFCGGNYDYYRQNASTQSGTFKLHDGQYYTDSRINFWMNDGKTSYRIDVDNDNSYGKLIVGHTYQIKFQNEEINIDKILSDPNC